MERANYAVYCTFGDGGAGMILADALKWIISSHSSWCGVHSAPTLGIIWFDMNKRMKAITRIQQVLAGQLSVKQYRSLVTGVLLGIRQLGAARAPVHGSHALATTY